MVGWALCGFHKQVAWSRYIKLVFLPLVGFAGHVVHSGASQERNIGTHFFMFEWDWFRFNKKRDGTRYTELVFLHPV
jgi:hypothetical protein